MYLVQSYRLKHKLPVGERFRLPSLEWLERLNARSLAAAAALVALGFVTGVLMRLAQRDGGGLPWTDPVVLSTSGMLSWLVAAEAFRLAYPAARRGRKVAYLTLAGFVFLVVTLAAFMAADSLHGKKVSSRELRVTSEKKKVARFESRILSDQPSLVLATRNSQLASPPTAYSLQPTASLAEGSR
jgi:hypothetical protein